MDIYIDTELIAREIAEMVKRYSTQPPAADWIPCKERLPEVGKEVLISSSGVLWLGYIDRNGLWNTDEWCEDEPGGDYVDAWVPLPKPYEVKE